MYVLLLQERISQTTIVGEGQFREFKSAFEGPPSNKKPRDPKAVAKDIAETLVAFANAEGGELLVGVEDDGNVTGFSYNDESPAEINGSVQESFGMGALGISSLSHVIQERVYNSSRFVAARRRFATQLGGHRSVGRLQSPHL